MLFNSLVFVGFFVVFYTGYLALRAKLRVQNAWLLGCSWLFYGFWDVRFLGLLILSTSIDFFTAQRIAAASERVGKRRWLLVSVIANLLILGFFKYFGFFADNLVALLSAIGISVDTPTLEFLLPVGLSFYTFQAIGYAVDVYRGLLQPERSYLTYATFIAFFPHLVAGPIQRTHVLLRQVAERRVLVWPQVHAGLWLIVWGFFKKLVIADNAAQIANAVFDPAANPSGVDPMLGVLAFTLQIYGDFSGYTDIARGLAKIMGFDLPLNFQLPYFALSPSDFWKRWHVSLSQWLRDYLYIPLGGNRGSELRTYRNLALTMVLGGLWHGAAWHFVFWGAFHGAILIVYRATNRPDAHPQPGTPAWRARDVLPRMAVMFVLTAIGWLLFRAESMGQVVDLVRSFGVSVTDRSWGHAWRIVALWLPLLAIELWQYRAHDLLAPTKIGTGKLFVLYVIMIIAMVLFAARGHNEFIYFAF
ncbi:MAG: MBOAT family protein [Deltaproteobacteria bacterium]|nr:MBOAT family protein [Deltaproteobacteria bacterium]